MEPNGAASWQVALDFHIVGHDRLIAGHAHPAGSGTIPGHPAVLLWELAREDLVANPVTQIIGLAHGSVSSFTPFAQAGSFKRDGPIAGSRFELTPTVLVCGRRCSEGSSRSSRP
jgi:hypothetical protein